VQHQRPVCIFISRSSLKEMAPSFQVLRAVPGYPYLTAARCTLSMSVRFR
jgi:hypothetical protein